MTEQKITQKRKVAAMTILFMLLYTVSYLTRINYGTVIMTIVWGSPLEVGVVKMTAAGGEIGIICRSGFSRERHEG